jgi:hypothetical protein
MYASTLSLRCRLSRGALLNALLMQNREAIDQLNKWTKAGFRLKGGKSDLGFLFCYELMTGTLPFRILHDDSPYLLACIIIRLFPAKDHQVPSLIMSVLRTLARNMTLATNPSVPKISTDKQSRMLPIVFPRFTVLLYTI